MSFQKYKEQVTIIEVAEALGYERNIKKGNRKDKGQVFERSYVENGKTYKDKVVINNLVLGISQQKYYNEDDSKGFEDRGDVIDFILRRLQLFNNSFDIGKPYVAVNNILAKFANEVYNLEGWINNQGFTSPENHIFDRSDWSESSPTIQELQYFKQERRISEKTLTVFLPFIRKVSNKKWKPGNYNFAFPYTVLPFEITVGYELKNYNLKLAATGTNKMEGSFHACFADLPGQVSDIFLFESAIDLMSYYDLYSHRVSFKTSAFFSLGGNLSKGQIENIINYYPDVMIHCCFDNDFNGNLFDIQTACIHLNKTYSFIKNKQQITCEIGEKKFVLSEADFNLVAFKHISGLRPNVRSHRPKNAKDFNEMLANMKPVLTN